MSLKQYHWDWKRSTSNTHIWWTPYLESKLNRNLRNTTLSLGSLSHVNNYFMEHFRLNLQQGEEKLKVTGDLHLRFTKRNFVANFLTNFDIRNFFQGTT